MEIALRIETLEYEVESTLLPVTWESSLILRLNPLGTTMSYINFTVAILDFHLAQFSIG